MKDKVIRIGYKKNGKKYIPCFAIDVQGFSLTEVDTKRGAVFYCEMLKIAFENLAFPYFGEIKSETIKARMQEMANPNIKVELHGLVDINCKPKKSNTKLR